MKRMFLPLCSLFLVIACGDDSSSAYKEWYENQSSSSDVELESSSSSRHSGLDPESSSSWIVTTSSSSWQALSSNSRNDVESSSSSRDDVSSSSQNVILSSSEGSSNSSSSSWIASSSSNSRNDVKSSSSSRNDVDNSSSSRDDVSSSSQNVIQSSSEGSSSSSMDSISSSSLQNDKSSSSVVVSSSSEILTDPSKIFEIRKPKGHVLPCEVPWGGEGEFMRDTLSQHDVICTYDYNGEKGFLYVQLTPISCGGGMSITPGRYNVDKAEFYVDGKFADVSDVDYEWGSNHHVEKLWFTYKENVFLYSQSTMGWGGRPCQNMDCLKVFESDGKTYVENGCNERSLPIVCRNINSKGEVVSDFTDTYKVCEGDPRTLGYDVEY